MPKQLIYTFNGFTGNIKEISVKFNVEYYDLYKKLKQNVAIENAIQQSRYCKYYTFNGCSDTLSKLSKKFDISRYELLKILRK